MWIPLENVNYREGGIVFCFVPCSFPRAGNTVGAESTTGERHSCPHVAHAHVHMLVNVSFPAATLPSAPHPISKRGSFGRSPALPCFLMPRSVLVQAGFPLVLADQVSSPEAT